MGSAAISLLAGRIRLGGPPRRRGQIERQRSAGRVIARSARRRFASARSAATCGIRRSLLFRSALSVSLPLRWGLAPPVCCFSPYPRIPHSTRFLALGILFALGLFSERAQVAAFFTP